MRQLAQMRRTGRTGQNEGRRLRPGLCDLVLEASQALARLDAPRLEELALSCRALNRTPGNPAAQAEWACETGDAAHDMAVLARVLEATRANLEVMRRLRDLRTGRLEYGPGRGRAEPKAGGHGDD